ncbi:MAG: DUF4249 family protein [Bacteroidota bacterium]|nr:DUF4249 family protein [Bacteroidota bacterium]
MSNYISIIVLLAMISFLGCKDLVNENFEAVDPVQVVNSFLIQDSAVKIHVSMIRGLDDKEIELISNANVFLIVDGEWTEKLSYHFDGYYKGLTIVEAGRKYSCVVELNGFKEIFCEDSIPFPYELTGIEHINNAAINYEGIKIPAIEFTFKNEPNEVRYGQFVIHLLTNQGTEYESWRKGFIQETVDPVLLSEGLNIQVFSNENITGNEYTMHVNYNTGSSSCGDDSCWVELYPVVFELRSISENYYNYLRQLKLYEKGRFPDFGGLSYGVFPLHSNVSNGYGIFAGYSTVYTDTIFPNQ